MNKITRFVLKSGCLNGMCNVVLALSALFLLSSCGSKDAPDTPIIDAPRLIVTSPVNGAKDIPAGELTVVLTYDQKVTLKSDATSKITIAGATVSEVSTNLTKVTIKVTGLAKSQSYELAVPEGCILGPTAVKAAQATIAFSTIDEAGVVPALNELCTTNPLPQTQKVYDYLVSVYGKKTLSGTMANVNWNIAEAELVKNATGKYPAINFFDYIQLYASAPGSWIDYSDTRVAEEWWNAGGLIGAGWHWLVPPYEGASTDNMTYEPDKTTFRARNATTEGTWENKVVKADLEKIAGYLKLLQDKKIPVVWRPLHEAAGNIYEFSGGKAWFWWGYDGAEAYKKLWIYMFNYFKDKGINNLIWVWTTQQKDAEFYPGDAYVDIVGRDIYNQKSGADNASQYKKIAETYPKKLVALSECGSVATMSAQWQAGAHWSFFMPWYQYNATTLVGHEHADDKWWTDAMKQEFVVTRDQLPPMK